MSVRVEIMFCFPCKAATDHVVKRDKAGEVVEHICRVCKHKHVCGSNHNV